MLERAFDEVSAAALAGGELVAIFPEGKITSDGELCPFRPGISRILERNAVPVIPVALSGLWGSIFSETRRPATGNHGRRDPSDGSP
ncbi:1-acyl-sn-glycerol-3-phosphate acyltransferase [Propionivibrio sp.]|uniref:1-acyl-sn-glycerol-3-phosphate acyltransferase n=1 Tax=Propionivibrio sp. TaxID=2212460 RepID=UPI0025D3055A|nr:1-acyl-sn-glycerol-3-phosphate acyltransferase [Propionivibrio sp.]